MSRAEAPGPVGAELNEPWQAEALALSIALQETGRIAPAEWSGALSDAISKARAAGGPADGASHYIHVIAALERLLAEKGILTIEAIDRRQGEWEEAFRRTPHGQPVILTDR